MITLSSFNRYFGNNPLQTLTKIRDESIENGNPELTKEAREKLGNSFINMYKDYVKLSDKVELVEGSIEDKLRKNEFSESEVKSLFKWIDENTKSPHWMEVDGVSYDEAYIKVFHTSKNIDEFKTKYLELQQKYLVDFRNINSSQKNSEENKEEAFKPIQAESKNKETYKDDSTRNELVKKLLEGKFSTSKELELLFGMKFSDDDAGEFNKILSLNSTPKSIDIKA
ncbi:hypothetical protein FV629_05930 [Campylobacter jejuni]|uniref:hypothetical protein n=1 Tax=Campylobacter jejuni TaxID=197 RepID=UPI000458AA62|nr:hypothetical protein [Campylobacter jejuni]EAI6222885.1 hypothetical protein [Campylobacter jejuni]EDP3996370.1 hypothetical protein [Campylobacter jejuni]EJD2280913.1 hypothetical protein [Campylobacter jejuni]KDA24366.1 hypothetical protein N212_02375 [Campylobacter jejuni 30318]MCC3107477.1 hypothetical protein [Campylobacter jejuni]